MTRKSRKAPAATVTWLSERIVDPNCLSNSFIHYEKFQFQNIIAAIGDFVLISNADAAEPDTEDGCDAAKILSLYEDSTNNSDPFRAKVQWYSRPSDLPDWCRLDNITFLEKEVIEDHRPFNTDVSIETFFKKCSINFTFTGNSDHYSTAPFYYICRYRLLSLTKRKVNIEPVMEEERKALQLLKTPIKSTSSPKTPQSLVKRMNRLSMSEQMSWSISKAQGTKLLLKKAILTDRIEKDTPKKTRTPKISITEPPPTPKKGNFEEIISMELEEDSDEELPTLIIRQNVPATPKRKHSITKITEETAKKTLFLDEDNSSPHTLTRSGRTVKSKINYREEELSPVKRTSRRAKKPSESEEEFKVRSLTKTGNETPKKALGEQSTNDVNTVTRSGRHVKKKISYLEEISPVKQTARRVRKTSESDDEFKPLSTPQRKIMDTPKRTPRRTRKMTENEEEFTPVPKTPQTPRTPAQSAKKSVSRKILCQLIPGLQTRVHSIVENDEFMKDNKTLTGREKQMDEILSFVKDKLLDRSSGCMYISGVPGTGKTATVSAALNILKEDVDLPEFQLVEINGMRIAEPRQAYVQIYKQLTGKTVVWEQACSLLEKRFTNPGSRRTPTVLLVDELDALCTRRQDVLYSIMEWAAHNTALLTVLAVANTMDLPERALEARVASRLGLTRLTFPPYTHTQLQQIVATRLAGANVTADALQLIARKVAAVSGDARRAISLSARAIELAGPGGAGLREVQKALDEASSGSVVTAIKHCSPAERLILRAVAAEVERTGSDETTLSRALSTAAAIVSLDGRPYRSAPHVRAPTPSQAKAICSRLAALRLLLIEPKPSEPRLLLNVSPDDIHYATKQIAV